MLKEMILLCELCCLFMHVTEVRFNGPNFPFDEQVVRVNEQDDVELECASGDIDEVTFEWYKNGSELLDTTPRLILDLDDGSGFYCCVIYNNESSTLNTHCATVIFSGMLDHLCLYQLSLLSHTHTHTHTHTATPEFVRPTLDNNTDYYIPPDTRVGLICNGITDRNPYLLPNLTWIVPYYTNILNIYSDEHGLAYLMVDIHPATNELYYTCVVRNNEGTITQRQNVFLKYIGKSNNNIM